MKIFHVYNEDCYAGLEKNGLINKDTGFKIQNVFSVPKARLFNNIAAVGGKLHSLIKENRYPLYVDRIAGGITYFEYEYDRKLIEEYSNLLGDWFLGFQLHESASNRCHSDWSQILKLTGERGPYDIKLLDEKFPKKGYAKTPDGEILRHLSQGTIYEYAALHFPETAEDFYEDIRWMFKKRMEATYNNILPADSYFLMTRLQNELGMKTFMPEVGAQIPHMRVAVALARGIAKSEGKTWGAYYECWMPTKDDAGNIECTMPCFNLEPINEWYLTQETHPDDFTSFGENGGSSRLLQNRIYYHSLMSGAHYFSEEWGLNCSYYDMKSFELSPYGEIKKTFIHNAEKLQGIKAETPFGIVLPKEYGAVILPKWDNIGKKVPYEYMEYTLPAEQEKCFAHIEKLLEFLLGCSGFKYGNEEHVLTNTDFGDVFDIIYEDTPHEAMSGYKYLVDATPDGAFAAKCGKKYHVIESGDMKKLKQELTDKIREVMPVYVSELCWLVSTDENNRRYLSIFNNEGNTRSILHGDVIDSNADRVAEVTFKEATDIKIVYEGNFSSEIIRKDDNTYLVKVPATGFVIVEF